MSKPKDAAPLMYMVPLKGEHAQQIKLTEHEAPHTARFSLAELKQLEGPHAVTVMLDGVPILLMGAWQLWENRAFIYSFYSQDATAERFGELLTYVRAFLDGLPFRRLEMAIDVDFLPGHQWVRSLGFEREAERMRFFHADGRDCSLYSRIKEEVSHG